MHRKKNVAILSAAVLVGSLGLAGCGDDDGSTTDTTTLEGEVETDESTVESDAETDVTEAEEDMESTESTVEDEMEEDEGSDS